MWRMLVSARRIKAVDLIGFGLSDKPEKEEYYTIKGFSKFIVDFLGEIGIKEKEHKKISIVGHSLGGYIAAQVAIENKDLIEKLVLIDSSGLLEGPTPLLNEYRIAATETEPILRYKKLEIVFGDMYANRSFMPPVVVDAFIGTIIKQGAKNALRVESILVRNCLLISALGMLLFFTINQHPPLQDRIIPPFGVVSKSFIGLSCYMIFIGIYTTVTYLSRRNTLTNIVLRKLSTDRLFGSFVRSEQEIQLKEIIRKNMDHIKSFQEVKSQDLSKDEIDELVNLVKKEISGHKTSEGS